MAKQSGYLKAALSRLVPDADSDALGQAMGQVFRRPNKLFCIMRSVAVVLIRATCGVLVGSTRV